MSEIEDLPLSEKLSLSRDILRLYDEFTEFNDRCSFLCDAFSGIVANHEDIDVNTIHGFSHYSNCLKQQVGDFKVKLKYIQEKSRHECKTRHT